MAERDVIVTRAGAHKLNLSGQLSFRLYKSRNRTIKRVDHYLLAWVSSLCCFLAQLELVPKNKAT